MVTVIILMPINRTLMLCKGQIGLQMCNLIFLLEVMLDKILLITLGNFLR